MLGVCDQVLIKYLVDNLGIEADKKHENNPITMMFSVLALVLSNYTTLKPIPVANEAPVQ
jgi:hypothetical protein